MDGLASSAPDPVLEHWATWLGIRRAALEAAVDANLLADMAAALQLPTVSRAEQIARRFTMTVLRRLGPAGRWAVTTLLKRVRGVSGYRALQRRAWTSDEVYLRLAHALAAPGFQWGAKRAAVCLTHDIDSIWDWNALPSVLALERSGGMRSTINLLTQGGYALDSAAIHKWCEEGFEFGLHGDDHDMAFGFRSAREIRSRLDQARRALPIRPVGFRAPALSSSRTLMTALDALEFQYDSSWLTGAGPGKVGTCFPFCPQGNSLWEIPLTLQDSMLFRDESLDEAAALQVTREHLSRVIGLHGVFVLNTHPGILERNPRYYSGVLEELRSREADVMVTTMSEAAAIVARSRQSQVTVGRS